MRKNSSVGVAACFLLFAGCATRQPEVITLDRLKDHPSAVAENYDFDSDSALIDRVTRIPDFLLADLKTMDGQDSYKAYVPSAEEQTMIGKYLLKLPPLHDRVLRERLIGMYFVYNFLGSGMATFAVDSSDEIFVLLIFHPDTLKTDISEWMTYRESTCFDLTESPEVSIQVECGREYTGFLYILLHESTHAVDYVRRITPFVEPVIRDIGLGSGLETTEFTSGIWSEYNTPLPASDFRRRADVTFYGLRGGPLIPAREASSVYDSLLESPFVSLYSSMNWAEDLAELVTWYHYNVVLEEPYVIQLYQNGTMAGSWELANNSLVSARFPSIRIFYY